MNNFAVPTASVGGFNGLGSLGQAGAGAGGLAAAAAASGAGSGLPGSTYGAPIPLTPLILPSDMMAEEAMGVGGGGGGFVTKFFALPIFIVLPIVAVVVAVVAAVVAGGGGGLLRKLFGIPTPRPYYEETTPYTDYTTTEMPVEYTPGYGQPNRKRRAAADKESSGLPVMSIAQVERMTEVVFAAMRSQECIQRLLCEVGTLSKSYSDTAHSVAKAVEQFVPESIKESYEVFTKAEKCEQYRCGTLQVKK